MLKLQITHSEKKKLNFQITLMKKLTVTIGSKNGYKLKTTLLILDILPGKNPIKSRKEKFLNKFKNRFSKK